MIKKTILQEISKESPTQQIGTIFFVVDSWLAIKGSVRGRSCLPLALLENVARLFVVLIDVSVLIRSNSEFNYRTEGQVIVDLGGAGEIDATLSII